MRSPSALAPPWFALLVVLAAGTGWAGAPASTTDATATDSPSRVGASGATAQGAGFSPSVVTAQRGDVLRFTVRTSDPGTVYLGSGATGFLLRVNVTGGRTNLALNTYETDPDGMVSGVNDGRVTLLTGNLSEPLAPLEYEMNVTVGGVEQAIGRFVVEPRTTGNSRLWVAPGSLSSNQLNSPSKIRSNAVRLGSDTPVADQDWVVFQVNVSGVAGFLDRSTLGATDDTDAERRDAAVAGVQPVEEMNRRFRSVYGDELDGLVRNETGDTYYLLVDTNRHNLDATREYLARFELGAANPLVEANESTNATFRIVPRSASFRYDGTRIEARNETVVEGETTLAPGSAVEVHARYTGRQPFLKERTVTVGPNRTFSASFEFTDLPTGAEFEFRLPEHDVRVPAVKAGPEPTTTTTTTTTTTPNATTTTATNATTSTGNATTTAAGNATTSAAANATTADGNGLPADVTTAAPLTPGQVPSQGLPGFGFGVAALAVVAAVALLLRRPG